MLRKTKIVCTLGPSTDQEGVMRNMIVSGMNVARFNFSHGSHEEHAARLAKLRALRDELCMPVAALLDTKGPEIRLKNFKNGKVTLKAGQTFTLTTRDVEGDENICSITYKELPQDLTPGARVLLDDGLVGMKVDAIQGDDIICTVQNGGPVSNHKGVNVPGTKLSMPYMSAQDRDDILFGIEQGFDFIAASFVRSAADILEIRRLLDSRKSWPRSKTTKAWKTSTRSSTWPTALWWRAAIWAWRSTLPRSPSSRRTSSGAVITPESPSSQPRRCWTV